MPKNQFQRPQPIIRTNNVPRHGQAQKPPVKVAAKPAVPAKPELPSLAKLLNGEPRH